ncbi:terminase small subunit [Paenibacillus kobensis]|uniref:terminase small subunit n=1 Tax=Paenibacillus kobensis TaxID=59841 RepID=UPI000FDB1B0C|nr:terminase small subunit [Paenibacillus kobensis]
MADTKTGRPLKFKSAKELQKKIDEYFESCSEEIWYEAVDPDTKLPTGVWVPCLDRHGQVRMQQSRPYTISGLADYLGTTRRTLLDYEQRDDEFSHTITRAKAKIENYTEEQLYDKVARNMTGIIFNLKNNYGWQDKQEIEQTTTTTISVRRKKVSDDAGSDD